MCGILGFVNAEKFGFNDAPKIFEEMLRSGILRGPDATGVLAADIHGNRRVIKRGLHAYDYMTTSGYVNQMKPFLGRNELVLGHNRFATKGSHDDICAHPFTDRHITLVHNGFISNHYALSPTNQDFEVDSMAAAYIIAEKGEKEGLESLQGAFALAWYNQTDKTLNFARNAQRELWVQYVEGKKTMFFASEWLMMNWILGRNDVKLAGKYILVPEMQHIKISLADPKEYTKVPFAEPPNRKAARSATGSGASTVASTDTTPQATTTPTTGAGIDSDRGSLFRRQRNITNTEAAQINALLERVPKKARSTCGIPTSKKKLGAAYVRLADKGVRLGQSISIYIDKESNESWKPYHNQRDRGVLVASKRADHSVRVEIPNINREMWGKLKACSNVYCTIVNLRKGVGNKPCLIGYIEYGRDTIINSPVTQKSSTIIQGPIFGPNGKIITKQMFIEMTLDGCGQCFKSIDPARAHECAWWGDQAVCHDCAPDFKKRMGTAPTHTSEVN